MRPIQILADSCADLSKEMLEKYGLDYARMNTVYGEKQTPASLTWEYYTPRELYDIMRGGDRVTTTQVPVEEFTRVFRLYLDGGFDVIYIGCSGKQSGSVNTGTVVARQLLAEYPGARIACIDSLNASIGIGMLCIRAAELNRAGVDFDGIVADIEAHRNLVNQYVTVQSLDWLRRAGRVKASKAFFGNLLGVKPVLISDADGTQTPIGKAKGRAASLAMIADRLAETIVDSKEQTLYIAHADCPEEEIAALREALLAKIPCRGVETVYIGPIIGASVGPNTVGVWAYGKEVTYRVGEV